MTTRVVKRSISTEGRGWQVYLFGYQPSETIDNFTTLIFLGDFVSSSIFPLAIGKDWIGSDQIRCLVSSSLLSLALFVFNINTFTLKEEKRGRARVIERYIFRNSLFLGQRSIQTPIAMEMTTIC